jgi:protein-disulfide isomerase
MLAETTFFDRLATGALVVSAIALSGAVVVREVRSRSEEIQAQTIEVEEWKALLRESVSLTPSARGAPVSIVVFTDFECSACARFHLEVVPQLVSASPGRVDYRVAHFPLGQHQNAVNAARAFECASRQDQSAAFAGELFLIQDSLSTVEWSALAARAGVRDTSAFKVCNASTVPDRVLRGQELGGLLGVRGTPTIAINGTLLPGVPSIRALQAFVARSH